jgi:CIC family chloride channel protein
MIRWRYARHMLGMLFVGVLTYVLFRAQGQYYVDGVGYATIESILVGQTSAAWLLGMLFVCTLLATSTSVGSGSSGGIFPHRCSWVPRWVAGSLRCCRNSAYRFR